TALTAPRLSLDSMVQSYYTTGELLRGQGLIQPRLVLRTTSSVMRKPLMQSAQPNLGTSSTALGISGALSGFQEPKSPTLSAQPSLTAAAKLRFSASRSPP